MTSVELTDMVMTLKMRNKCVRPQGTIPECQYLLYLLFSPRPSRVSLTVSEVTQVRELVTPLGDDSDGVLDKCDHDQKSSDGREIPTRLIQSAIVVVHIHGSQNLPRPGLSVPGRLVRHARRKGCAHGFRGSLRVFNQSSILLVCSRIWSRGLGSLVALVFG